MNDDATSFPLYWPDGWKRTVSYKRKDSRFSCTTGQAIEGVLAELDKVGKRNRRIVLSTNIPLRRDGIPYARTGKIDDPGAAAYWTDKKSGKPMAIACDTYREVWENIRALEHTLKALRSIERHGASELLERAYRGFAALPDVRAGDPPWHEVLLVSPRAPTDVVAGAARRLKNTTHPDNGGDAEKFRQVVRAWETFKKERGL